MVAVASFTLAAAIVAHHLRRSQLRVARRTHGLGLARHRHHGAAPDGRHTSRSPLVHLLAAGGAAAWASGQHVTAEALLSEAQSM